MISTRSSTCPTTSKSFAHAPLGVPAYKRELCLSPACLALCPQRCMRSPPSSRIHYRRLARLVGCSISLCARSVQQKQKAARKS